MEGEGRCGWEGGKGEMKGWGVICDGTLIHRLFPTRRDARNWCQWYYHRGYPEEGFESWNKYQKEYPYVDVVKVKTEKEK